MRKEVGAEAGLKGVGERVNLKGKGKANLKRRGGGVGKEEE